MGEWLKATAPAVGAVATAAASALCCAGPLVAVSAGVSGAGLAATFEPLRPYFLVATGLLILLGFGLLDRDEKKACEPGKACASPRSRRAMRTLLWTATGIAVFLATFPAWQTLVL